MADDIPGRWNVRTLFHIHAADRVSGVKNALTRPDDREFSLVLGGPLYQLYFRTGLLTSPLGLPFRRVVGISLICWGPLLMLSALAGQALGGVTVPFLLDVDVHVRLFVAIPLLIFAELAVHRRLMVVVRQFIERDIITPEHRARFEQIIASTMRLRNSIAIEVALLLFCFGVGHWVWAREVALSVPTWYSMTSNGAIILSKAGYWYAFVSLPIFRFLLFRWYFRMFLWYTFLWRVRGLPLQLNLYHPDRAAGLGFLAGSVPAFSPVLLAQTALISGVVADRIWHTGANLTAFRVEIAGGLTFLMLWVLVPLAFFVKHLDNANRVAKREFGILSSKYVNCFRAKWIEHDAEEDERLLGTPDIQSLADLGNSFKAVSEISLFPFGKQTVARLLGVLILPLLPLMLTIIPLREVVSWAVKLVF
jgi:hypothetical protein